MTAPLGAHAAGAARARLALGCALGLALGSAAAASAARGDDGRALTTADGAPLAWEALVARATAARVVYVGEEHGVPAHHALQRDLLAALDAAGPVALACEYFPRSLQPALDRVARGELDLAGFRAAVAWDTTWGHAWEAYAPLFELAVARRIPVVALNAERALVQRVRKEGLARLPLEDLLGLPRIDLGVAAHGARVRAQLQVVHPLPPEALERYYQAFTVWDEVMADSVHGALLRDPRPGLRVLVVAGRAHIEGATGIPDRVSRRFPAPRLVVVCGRELDARHGDVLLHTRPAAPLPPAAPAPPAPEVQRREY